MRFRERFETKLARYGESIVVNGASLVRAFTQEMQGSQMSIYLDSSAYQDLTKPAVLAVVEASAAVQVGDRALVSGRLLTVRKTVPQSLSGEQVCKALILY